MILKHKNSSLSLYNCFDILGNDENALSKAFAYLLSINKDCFFEFLHILNIQHKNSLSNYKKYKIEIQKNREAGITDIEITDDEEIHVIIECKIKKGTVGKQRNQYNKEFNKNKSCKKFLVLLTNNYDSNITQEDNIKTITLSWYDIIVKFNSKRFLENELVKNFVQFAERNYKVNDIKEILIQDLSDETEVKRYKEYCIYRRGVTYGSPLYFAPFFTKKNKDKNTYGIKSLSKILGIITSKPCDIKNFISEFEKFSANKELIEKWKKGIKLKHSDENRDDLYTYYFLEHQVEFKNPLTKETNWLGRRIPKNRNVSFSEFLKHIPELMN